MEVLDLIQSAAAKCGVVSSFSLDDMPGDVIDNGRRILQTEVLPQLNCDRTLDITVTARYYVPEGGQIIIKPFVPPCENFEIIGYSKYTADELLNDATLWAAEVERLRPDWFNPYTWPVDDFGANIKAGMWSADIKMVGGNSPISNRLYEGNIDFPAMRVENVIDTASKIEYSYVYRSEFERTLPGAFGIYTTEEYDNCIRVLIKGAPGPKTVILPVPLQIVNADQQHCGIIKAPDKFRKYIVDAMAVQLAIVYGMSTLAEMKEEAKVSFNLLKKNHPQPFHKANVSERIAAYLGNKPGYLTAGLLWK